MRKKTKLEKTRKKQGNKCAQCGQPLPPPQPREAEAMEEEYKEIFSPMLCEHDDRAVVCDDCFKHMLPERHNVFIKSDCEQMEVKGTPKELVITCKLPPHLPNCGECATYKERPMCEWEGCVNRSDKEFSLPDPANIEGPDILYHYCFKHAHEAGFCSGCGRFLAGVEDFEFSKHGLCSECLDELKDELGEYDEDEDDDLSLQDQFGLLGGA